MKQLEYRSISPTINGRDAPQARRNSPRLSTHGTRRMSTVLPALVLACESRRGISACQSLMESHRRYLRIFSDLWSYCMEQHIVGCKLKGSATHRLVFAMTIHRPAAVCMPLYRPSVSYMYKLQVHTTSACWLGIVYHSHQGYHLLKMIGSRRPRPLPDLKPRPSPRSTLSEACTPAVCCQSFASSSLIRCPSFDWRMIDLTLLEDDRVTWHGGPHDTKVTQ